MAVVKSRDIFLLIYENGYVGINKCVFCFHEIMVRAIITDTSKTNLLRNANAIR